MNKEAQLPLYNPHVVYIPDDAGIERDIQTGRRRVACDESHYDSKTLFYDVFYSSDRRKLLCLGPPFLNIGPPLSIRHGRRRLSYSTKLGKYRFNHHVLSCVEVDLASFKDELILDFTFSRFNIAILCSNRNRLSLSKAHITLLTLQKDNPIPWIRDWCRWHNRVHNIGRIMIYDNGSRNITKLQAALVPLNKDIEIVLINWPFPYGPAQSHFNQYCQIGCLNHFRLFWGASTRWCLSLDIDEYLFANRNMFEQLNNKPSRAAIYLDSYLVSPTGRRERALSRFFHHSSRPLRTRRWAGKKYIYQPRHIKLNLVHRVIPFFPSFLHLGYGLQKRRDLLQKLLDDILRKGLGRKSPQRMEKPLFFYHFRGLNTGWKLETPTRTLSGSHAAAHNPISADAHHVPDKRIITKALEAELIRQS